MATVAMSSGRDREAHRNDEVGKYPMRNLEELNINEGGEPIDRPAPSTDDTRRFVEHFGVSLPEDYTTLLLFANGGCPEVNSFTYYDGEGESAVNCFYRLTSDRTDLYGVWRRTEHLRKVLSDANIANDVIAVGENGGGDDILLNMSNIPPSVHILYRTSGNSMPKIADSFGEFVDSLYYEPDEYEDI